LCGILAIFLSGCATYEGGANSAVQDREDMLLLREDVNRCKSRLETMEIEQKQILNEIQQLRARDGDDSRIDELERRIAALDAARSSDRKEIVDQISANVSKMMRSSAASKKAAPKTTSTAASSSSATGYEHVVQDGETLSAIASAYKTKLSAIIEANDLKKPYVIRQGQKLFIPQ